MNQDHFSPVPSQIIDPELDEVIEKILATSVGKAFQAYAAEYYPGLSPRAPVFVLLLRAFHGGADFQLEFFSKINEEIRKDGDELLKEMICNLNPSIA